jgi:hypothetical protein
LPAQRQRKSAEEKITVEFAFDGLSPDPRPYKPWSPHLAPEKLYVAVEVPKSLVLSHSTKRTVLSLEGWAYVMNECSLAIAKMTAP